MLTTPASCHSSIMVSGSKTAPSAQRTTTGVQLVGLFQSYFTQIKRSEEFCCKLVPLKSFE